MMIDGNVVALTSDAGDPEANSNFQGTFTGILKGDPVTLAYSCIKFVISGLVPENYRYFPIILTKIRNIKAVSPSSVFQHTQHFADNGYLSDRHGRIQPAHVAPASIFLLIHVFKALILHLFCSWSL